MTKMTAKEADMLLYYLYSLEGVSKVKVYDLTGDAAVTYTCSRASILKGIQHFHFNDEHIQALVPEETGRELTNQYRDKLTNKVIARVITKLLLPKPIRIAVICFQSIHYLAKGVYALWKHRLEVSVLDATAIGVSLIQRDFNTASSVMFLLGVGELLEEWTHKKSVADLARSMSLNVEKVWLKQEQDEILVPISEIQENDQIIVHLGNLIPLDGIVCEGEALINQASLTGEALPVQKRIGSYVYAGTVIEEGELTLTVKEAAGSTRFEKIVTMIEESEKLKSTVEGRAEHLADSLVPYSFLGTGLVYLFTKNITKALSVLMVDFSCALKLAMPIAVLSAMRECSSHKITVKGGKFLESVAQADTIVFDKTGTLTKAQPVVADIITFSDHNRDDMLRLAACLEEHFPHSMANAVVKQAEKEGLHHKEMHSKVEYIVAHGISSYVNGQKVIIGSPHFVFEDEQCVIPEGEEALYESRPAHFSHLYLGIAGKLAAIICIEDPLREEAPAVLKELKKLGIRQIVMMTGDSERTAHAIAKKVGVDHYFSEVLPEDKAHFVESEKAKGYKVIMIGDGINDSPALSAADAGIAISEGAAIAKEISDITISENDLAVLLILKRISNQLMRRINGNYHFVVGFNLSLILLGISGIFAPSTSALFHNLSTLGISLNSMTNLIPEETIRP